jgi:hypothetical protein
MQEMPPNPPNAILAQLAHYTKRSILRSAVGQQRVVSAWSHIQLYSVTERRCVATGHTIMSVTSYALYRVGN